MKGIKRRGFVLFTAAVIAGALITGCNRKTEEKGSFIGKHAKQCFIGSDKCRDTSYEYRRQDIWNNYRCF